ncbi:MAG: ADP-ribosylation factor-like protein [Candidatus Heimdallarchaeaceae archaeon]
MSYLFDEIYGNKEDAPKIEDKILLMGLQAAGKTAIKDVVFFNKEPSKIEDYMATVHYQRHFVDGEKKSLIIDSGGQESYWNEAVTQFRHLVFSDVKLLMWVVDVTKPELFEESERRFSFTIRQFKKENPEGKITVLCHKVDLVTPEKMVVIHQHIRDMFDDPKYNIEFENTSIYYPDSLKELIFTVMKEAGINTKRFELISNIGQKIEESDEFKSYVLEHEEDPRIQQLREFLNPEPRSLLPTFGKLDIAFDLSEYDIVEIVLIDKKTYNPIVGASSQSNVNVDKSMDYLIGLHELKSKLKELGDNIPTTGSVISSNDNKLHAMVFNLATNFLFITSFSEISEEKKAILYELIFKFAQSTEKKKKEEVPQVSEVVEEATTVEPSTIEVLTPSGEIEKIETTDAIPIEMTELEVMADKPLEVEDEIPVEMAELELDTDQKFSTKTVPPVPHVEKVTVDQVQEEPKVEVQEEPKVEVQEEPKVEVQEESPAIIEPVASPESVPSLPKEEIEEPVPSTLLIQEEIEGSDMQAVSPPQPEKVVTSPELKSELEDAMKGILIPSDEMKTAEQPSISGSTEKTEELMMETGTFVSGERDSGLDVSQAVPLTQEPSIIEEAENAVIDSLEEESIQISFDAEDIKNFANFLMKAKETVPEGLFSREAIKSMSEYLTQGIGKKELKKDPEKASE